MTDLTDLTGFRARLAAVVRTSAPPACPNQYMLIDDVVVAGDHVDCPGTCPEAHTVLDVELVVVIERASGSS